MYNINAHTCTLYISRVCCRLLNPFQEKEALNTSSKNANQQLHQLLLHKNNKINRLNIDSDYPLRQ